MRAPNLNGELIALYNAFLTDQGFPAAAKILRQIQAHAWNEGYDAAIEEHGGTDYGVVPNPYLETRAVIEVSPGTCQAPGCILEPGHDVEEPSGSGVIPAVPHKTLT